MPTCRYIAHRRDRERDQHRKEGQKWGERMDEAIGAVGHEVFLREHFDRIGEDGVDDAEVGQSETLADAEDIRAIGADAILNQR